MCKKLCNAKNILRIGRTEGKNDDWAGQNGMFKAENCGKFLYSIGYSKANWLI
jgi:hypothetical protein